MKKAFTLLELIFVIVVIGIIATIAIPKFKKNNLPKAGAQLVSYLRYAQHLAMLDDKFSTTDGVWYKRRWRVYFSKSDTKTQGKYAITIFSDTLGIASGNPEPSEVAVNPQNRNKKLTGGASSETMIATGDVDATDEMNIGLEYSIEDVDFSSSCRTGTTGSTIAFDNLGRPLRGALKNYNSAYSSGTTSTNVLISSQCVIDLCTVSDCSSAESDEITSIAIEPETGYIHVL